MREGQFTLYTIEHRRVGESPWGKPNEPIVPVKKYDWDFSSWDVFGQWFNPWKAYGEYKYPEAAEEVSDVLQKSGQNGWWSLKYAIQALKRIKKANEEHELDYFDTWAGRYQALDYEFRLVRLTVMQKTEILTLDDILQEV